MEEQSIMNDEAMSSTKAKFQAQLAEAQDELEQVKKAKAKWVGW